MSREQIDEVRRFNRRLTQRVGALEEGYLSRGRPLNEARLIFEIGAAGVDARALRGRLGLNSGYFSRLLRSLQAQGLIDVQKQAGDGRRRDVRLTRRGRSELASYDRLSDRLAAGMLAPLEPAQRERLVAAMGEVERLLRAASVEIAPEPPDSAEARACLDAYFRELATRFESGFDHGPDAFDEMAELTPPAGLFLIARLDGEPAGCGAVKRIDKTTGEIKRVWTAPHARGLGIARRILRRLEAGARDLRLKQVRLDTNRALKEAHALYRGEGYSEVPRFNDNPYAHHWFWKRL